MRFTKLRLNGFKSFVDPTDLVIHEGLTGVVGPNGCGKSNLLEAMRWVMGENRPSAMRGGGMEDVIFNGVATRGARHFAEVTLVMDNTDRLAPSGFNDSDTLEIVRRITRDAGSAYKLNSKEVRARDVQMLFADASTGSHSPALVRQGQIAELINAKPKARRRILEEAAGISGLYARRHEAELKLSGAEANLLRVDDVLEQLAQQLSVLMRQAKQVARYREIGDELRRSEGQLLFRRWREADHARGEAQAVFQQHVILASQAEAASRLAANQRAAAEEALPDKRSEEMVAGAIVQRLLVQRDQLSDQEARARSLIDSLKNRLSELDRDKEREAGLNQDAVETIVRLDWEIAQLVSAHDGSEQRLDQAAETARKAAAALVACETVVSQATEDTARLAARHQSAQRELSASRDGLIRADTAASRARGMVIDAEAALLQLSQAFEIAEETKQSAIALAQQTDEALLSAEEARAKAQESEAIARDSRSKAEGEASTLRAEIGALTKLIERESASGLQLLDQIKVIDGMEKAIGAALADDLLASEVGLDKSSGWVVLSGYSHLQSLPSEAQPLGDFVTAPGVLGRRLQQTGLVDRDAGGQLQEGLQPGQRLVSREGDLWRWDGFRAGAGDTPSAAVLRLQQLNRLGQLKREFDAADARCVTAVAAHLALQSRLTDLARADQLARDARRAADTYVAETNRVSARAEAEKSIAAGKLEAVNLSLGRLKDETIEAQDRLDAATFAIDDLDDIDQARSQLEIAKTKVEGARADMLSARSAYDEVQREGEARIRRRQEATIELSHWRLRLETAQKRYVEMTQRRCELEAELVEVLATPEEIAIKREELNDAIEVAEDRKRAATNVLMMAEAVQSDARHAERDAERLASEAREARARAQARIEAAQGIVDLAAERIAEESGATPLQLLDTLKVDPDQMPDAETLDLAVQRLKRQREALGAVNLLAEQDAALVNQEYDTLLSEKIDLEGAIKALRTGIFGLNKEGRERLLTAFEQVNTNFSTLFTHLFGGGDARLVLVESDDPLEAGLEIMCQPPGKRLSTLSLLSGGEQTLTALALIFGVFLANPAPICVLDEVDAPLDDANVTRFCDLLNEMARRTETRFLIITHHAVTMSRMDRLFGITMAEQGVSQLVSVDLKRAAAMVG